MPHQIAKVHPAVVAPASMAFRVAAGEDRFASALRVSDWRFDCKVSAKDTNGSYCIYDTVRTAKGGPPMHVHHGQDEWFFVREGEFIFKVGDEKYHLGPGDSLLGPRRVPHAFVSLSDNSTLIVAFVPAGTIEQLFHEISEVNRLRIPTIEDWCTISRAHAVDIVGPPLNIRSADATAEPKSLEG
jgi:mannose-6-phosphate isomerase-like protein (cupin superfamily)